MGITVTVQGLKWNDTHVLNNFCVNIVVCFKIETKNDLNGNENNTVNIASVYYGDSQTNVKMHLQRHMSNNNHKV